MQSQKPNAKLKTKCKVKNLMQSQKPNAKLKT